MLARPVLRSSPLTALSRTAGRRFESTANKAAESAKSAASSAASTTKQAASSAASTTKQAASSAASTTKEAASSAASTTKEAASSAASTTKQAASSAQETAADYTAKASQGLSRVTSSAGPAIAGAARGVGNALGKIGGRTGRLVSFVERQVPFVVYYSKVGLEVSKQVINGQKMSPPSVSTFQSYFNQVLANVRNPQSLYSTAQSAASIESAESAVNHARGLSRAQVVGGAVIVAELLGFFTIGEVIGKMKLIGYHGETGAHQEPAQLSH